MIMSIRRIRHGRKDMTARAPPLPNLTTITGSTLRRMLLFKRVGTQEEQRSKSQRVTRTNHTWD